MDGPGTETVRLHRQIVPNDIDQLRQRFLDFRRTSDGKGRYVAYLYSIDINCRRDIHVEKLGETENLREVNLVRRREFDRLFLSALHIAIYRTGGVRVGQDSVNDETSLIACNRVKYLKPAGGKFLDYNVPEEMSLAFAHVPVKLRHSFT